VLHNYSATGAANHPTVHNIVHRIALSTTTNKLNYWAHKYFKSMKKNAFEFGRKQKISSKPTTPGFSLTRVKMKQKL